MAVQGYRVAKGLCRMVLGGHAGAARFKGSGLKTIEKQRCWKAENFQPPLDL